MKSILTNTKTQHLYSLDFLKFMAVVMITNSHFQVVYGDAYKSLATFGVQGNALFFFVSGYLLMMGFSRKKMNFKVWYANRIRRLWPCVFIWTVVTAMIWKQPLTVGKLVFMDGYWFLQAIVLSYVVFYFISNNFMAIRGGQIIYVSYVRFVICCLCLLLFCDAN